MTKMSHEFESGLYVERPAWHGLGIVLPADHTFTTPELVAMAFPGPVEGMAWNVQTAPLTVAAHGTTYNVDGKCAVVRDVAPHILGIHSDQYPARQVLENAMLLHNALDGAAPWENMLSLGEGARTVFLAKLGDQVMVGGEDAVNLYGILVDSYDGSLPLTVGTTAVRVVCQNTLNMALPNIAARPHVKIKHTKNMAVRVDEVRNALSLSFKWAEGFAATADKLANETVSKGRFEQIIREAFPKSKADPAPFSREQYALIGVLESSPTIGDDIRYTGWGALNAVTEYLEWGKGRRNTSGSDDSTTAANAIAERRFEDAVLGGQKEATKVAELILA